MIAAGAIIDCVGDPQKNCMREFDRHCINVRQKRRNLIELQGGISEDEIRDGLANAPLQPAPHGRNAAAEFVGKLTMGIGCVMERCGQHGGIGTVSGEDARRCDQMIGKRSARSAETASEQLDRDHIGIADLDQRFRSVTQRRHLIEKLNDAVRNLQFLGESGSILD